MPLISKIRHCISKNTLFSGFGSNIQKFSRTCSEKNERNQPIQAPIRITQNPNIVVPIFQRALEFTENNALKDNFGTYTYSNLILGAKQIAGNIGSSLPKQNENIAFLCSNTVTSVVTLWAIWMTGHLAVPLNPTNPKDLLEHLCLDCNAKLLITTLEYAETMHKIAKKANIKLLVLDTTLQHEIAKKSPQTPAELECGFTPDFYSKENALILYSQDNKGVILSHKNLHSQINSLLSTWKWTHNDTMLHVLPLNDFQGLISSLLCPMSAGAQCTMLPKFDAAEIWSHLLAVKYNGELDHKITAFMATPIMYHKLMQEYEKLFAKNPRMVEYIKNVLNTRLRLMANASTPLSETLSQKWAEITGHTLIDTFGSAETGICLSTPIRSDASKGAAAAAGSAVGGVPVDDIAVRVTKLHERHNVLVDWTLNARAASLKAPVDAAAGDPSGNLLVKGDQVCVGYLNRPADTQQRFTKDGWFVTDTRVRYDRTENAFRLLHVDVIKTRGREVSALEIEHQLLACPHVEDCAVVGIPDPASDGDHQQIAAVLVGKNGVQSVDAENIKVWAKSKLPDWAVPSEVRIVDCLPKSFVGIVNKAHLIENYFPPKKSE